MREYVSRDVSKEEEKRAKISIIVKDGGSMVRILRLRLGFNTEELGSQIGVTGRLVRFWEKGDRPVHLSNIRSIASLLLERNTSPDSLFIQEKVESIDRLQTLISQELIGLNKLITDSELPTRRDISHPELPHRA